jgi:hypothetical protein
MDGVAAMYIIVMEMPYAFSTWLVQMEISSPSLTRVKLPNALENGSISPSSDKPRFRDLENVNAVRTVTVAVCEISVIGVTVGVPSSAIDTLAVCE